MGSFYAYDFEFDGVSSQMFDLKIISFEDGGLFNGIGSSNINIITQQVLRKSKPYFLGRTQEPVLEFKLTFGRAHPISAEERSIISKWLFGRANYKKLHILQDDLLGAYFNCFLTNPEPMYIGGVNYAFQVNVVCDSPFAYRDKKIVFTNAGNVWRQTIYNNSSEEAYTYPLLTYTLKAGAGVTATDGIIFRKYIDNTYTGTYSDTRLFPLGDNSSGSINNDTQVITGTPAPGLTILQCFSKNWFKLDPGANFIEIWVHKKGVDDWLGYSEGTIEFQERLKVGG